MPLMTSYGKDLLCEEVLERLRRSTTPMSCRGLRLGGIYWGILIDTHDDDYLRANPDGVRLFGMPVEQVDGHVIEVYNLREGR